MSNDKSGQYPGRKTGQSQLRQRRGPLGIGDGKGVMFVSHRGEIFPAGFLPLVAGDFRRIRWSRFISDIQRFCPPRPGPFFGQVRHLRISQICGGSRARAMHSPAIRSRAIRIVRTSRKRNLAGRKIHEITTSVYRFSSPRAATRGTGVSPPFTARPTGRSPWAWPPPHPATRRRTTGQPLQGETAILAIKMNVYQAHPPAVGHGGAISRRRTPPRCDLIAGPPPSTSGNLE